MFSSQILMKQNPLSNNFKVSLNSIYNAIWNNLYVVIYNRPYKSSFGSFGSSSPISILHLKTILAANSHNTEFQNQVCFLSVVV